MPSALNRNSGWLRRVMPRTFRSRQTPLTAMSLPAASSTGRSRSAAFKRCGALLHPHMQSGAVLLRQGLQHHCMTSLTACTCIHKCAALHALLCLACKHVHGSAFARLTAAPSRQLRLSMQTCLTESAHVGRRVQSAGLLRRNDSRQPGRARQRGMTGASCF